MPELLVRYYASARALSGVAQESLVATTVDDAVQQIVERHGPRMSAIVSAGSLLLDGTHVSDSSAALPPAGELDILPPFAGG